MSEPLKVLIVEDSEDDALLVVRELRRSGRDVTFERVETPEGLGGALERQEWDAVIADYSLPHLNGLEALELVQAKARDLPFVLVSGSVGEGLAVEAMRAGAHDYIMKNNLARLAPAVERELRDAQVRRQRRAAERALRASEEKYRRFVESLQEGIWVIDRAGRTTFVNPRMAEMLGYTVQEMQGRHLLTFMDEDNVEIAQGLLERRRVGVSRQQHESELRRKDGAPLYAFVSTCAILDENGEYAGALAGVLDITERRRAAEALRESEERYRRLFEESNDAVFIHGLDGRILDVNRRACQMAGLSEEELKTMQIQQLQTEEPVPTDSDFKDTSQSGSMRFESKIKRADGRLIDVDVSARLVDSEKGTVQAIFRDITERKRAEEQIESLAKFPAEDPNPVLRVSRDGTVEYANSASVRLLRFLGVGVGQRLRGTWRERIGDMLEEGLGEEVEVECEDRTFSLVCSPVAEQGYVNLYGRDITDRLALEEQLQRAAKLEAVGQLAGGVAHDFNNLLTAILGYVDLDLAEVPEETSLHEDLKRVRAAARRASDLTRQLLAFSRQQAARPEVLDLNATVENVSEMLGHLIEEHVELELSLSEEALTVRADPAQLEQVLMNLAVNARDAMPDGGLLTIETASVVLDEAYMRMHAGARAGPHAMLAVTDTGVGMPPEVRERIFDPFFTTKEVGQGTGLGLSTVYGIVQQHGGSIQCYSEPNIGTTFKVYLPLVGGAQAAAAEESVFEMGIMGEETILLAEDEPSVRDLAARVLQDGGYTVLCAADGAEAMLLVREHGGRIDLILTDVVMPKVNGPAMAREARSMCPTVKLLFMSGYAGDPVGRLGQGMSGVPILRKPFTARELTEKVRHALDKA